MDLEEARLAAKQGAAWLDEWMPEWADAIDTSRLDLMYPDRCVLGQTCESYFRGRVDLAMWLGRSPTGQSELDTALEGGFTAGPAGDWEEFRLLDEAWQELIAERKGQ